jgi:hypothetical protein
VKIIATSQDSFSDYDDIRYYSFDNVSYGRLIDVQYQLMGGWTAVANHEFNEWTNNQIDLYYSKDSGHSWQKIGKT